MMKIKAYRDIQLIEKDSRSWLAVACDVSAGIGNKEMDVVKVSPETAGYYAAAVPIIELLAIGAKPVSIADTIGVAMEGDGKAIIEGVKKAMVQGGIHEACLTGSTEDNMPTVQTSIGITVVAELSKVMLKSCIPLAGDALYVIGLPKMGQLFLEEEILANKGEVIDIDTVKRVRAMDGVSHILPVGSKGIDYEVSVLLDTYDLSMDKDRSISLDLRASAGPATCMIVACDKSCAAEMIRGVKQPVHYLGTLKKE